MKDNNAVSYDGEKLNLEDIPEVDFSGIEIVDMPGLERTPENMANFIATLKSGKAVRGAFAESFKKGYTIVVEHDSYDEVINVKKTIRSRRPTKKVSV